jgi:hypothetical protein
MLYLIFLSFALSVPPMVGAGRMRIRAERDHVLHANSTLVDRVDLATPLSLSSQPATGPSVLAPAQRAGAQRLCALARLRHADRRDQCPLAVKDRKTSGLVEYFAF